MYIVSTSRSSTAALGAAVGLFCGGSTTYVVVNRGTILSLFVCRPGDSGVDHVQDFHLHGTLKYVFAVPIIEPSSPREVSRHLLFLCTIKQEVILATLEKAAETAVHGNPLSMRTLFKSEPEDCLYQYEPGEVDLCCCSSAPAQNLHGSAVLPPPPFVAFALTRGELLFFDVFAALAREGLKRKRGHHFSHLMSADVMAEVGRRGKSSVFSHTYVDATEYDVRDIAFGWQPLADGIGTAAAPSTTYRTPLATGKGGGLVLPFYVLYADFYSRVHVSEYELLVSPSSTEDCATAHGAPRLNPHRLLSPNLRSGPQLFSSGSAVQRKGFLQSNVDPTATWIVPSRHGLFVVGNQLVTLILQVRPRKVVSSREIPSLRSSLDVSCATIATDGATLCVAFSDGVFAHVEVQSADVDADGASLNFRFLPQATPTIPTAVVAVHADLYLLCSRFDSTFTIRFTDMTCERVLHNCGPVLDMAIQQSGPRCSVVACTGLHRSGGVSVLRSAVMLREQATVPMHGNPLRLLCAGGVLCVASAVSNRFFRVSVSEAVIEELSPSIFPSVVARHPLLELGHDATLDLLVLVSARGLAWLRTAVSQCQKAAELTRREGEADYVFASARYGLVALCDGNDVAVYRGMGRVFDVPSFTGTAVSALSLVGPALLGVGDWDGNVLLYDLSLSQPTVVGRLRLSTIARSIVSVAVPASSLGKGRPPQLFYIGTLDGHLVETNADLLRRGETRRSVYVAPSPLELQPLGGQAGLLCLGSVPLVVLCGADGVQLTGLQLMEVTAAATLDAELQCYAVYSKQDSRVHVGCLEGLEKTTRTFLPVGATVTLMHEMPHWGGYVLAVRKVERDEVMFLPSSLVQSPWTAQLGSWRAAAVPLLENERCVFLQRIALDGIAEADGSAGASSTAKRVGGGGPQEDMAGTNRDSTQIVIVGSSFIFPDEQRARSGRMSWFSLCEGKQQRRLQMISGKDIGGALQCCAAVPNYKGRIALGVNGCVCLYKWNAEDKTFVAEERCRVGLTVTKLIPVYHTKLATSLLVALDVRYSAFFVEVDTLQGSIKMLCRDSKLRGAMDGHLGSDDGRLCLFDDHSNFTALQVVKLTPQESVEGNGSVTPPQYRYEVRAQCHLGHLVTCVHAGTFATTSVLAAEPSNEAATELLLPGIAGRQLVFASVLGGFGVLTPLSLPTYIVLRAVEVALERVRRPVAGLDHRRFKEPLEPGQERGINRVASEKGSTLVRQRRQHREALNTVDGDLVEGFLFLSSTEKAHVCQVASEVALAAYTECVNGDGVFVPHPAAEEQCPFPLGVATRPLSEYSVEAVTKVNAYLQTGSLPPLPFITEILEQLLMNLQRVH